MRGDNALSKPQGYKPEYAEICGDRTRIRVNSKSWIDRSERAIEVRKAQKYWNDGYCEIVRL